MEPQLGMRGSGSSAARADPGLFCFDARARACAGIPGRRARTKALESMPLRLGLGRPGYVAGRKHLGQRPALFLPAIFPPVEAGKRVRPSSRMRAPLHQAPPRKSQVSPTSLQPARIFT